MTVVRPDSNVDAAVTPSYVACLALFSYLCTCLANTALRRESGRGYSMKREDPPNRDLKVVVDDHCLESYNLVWLHISCPWEKQASLDC